MKLLPKHFASSDGLLHPCDAAPEIAKAACNHAYRSAKAATMCIGLELTYT